MHRSNNNNLLVHVIIIVIIIMDAIKWYANRTTRRLHQRMADTQQKQTAAEKEHAGSRSAAEGTSTPVPEDVHAIDVDIIALPFMDINGRLFISPFTWPIANIIVQIWLCYQSLKLMASLYAGAYIKNDDVLRTTFERTCIVNIIAASAGAWQEMEEATATYALLLGSPSSAMTSIPQRPRFPSTRTRTQLFVS